MINKSKEAISEKQAKQKKRKITKRILGENHIDEHPTAQNQIYQIQMFY